MIVVFIGKFVDHSPNWPMNHYVYNVKNIDQSPKWCLVLTDQIEKSANVLFKRLEPIVPFERMNRLIMSRILKTCFDTTAKRKNLFSLNEQPAHSACAGERQWTRINTFAIMLKNTAALGWILIIDLIDLLLTLPDTQLLTVHHYLLRAWCRTVVGVRTHSK